MKNKGISISGILIPLAVVFFNILIILFPKETISASKEGAALWFGNVLPALLPFAVGANILSMLGVVNFLGVLLEPFMLPLFNIPGSGGFALVIGLTSGYPMGAKEVSELRGNGEITKTQAERLIAFANNSGPLFILGAVAAGMFENAAVGYFIITVHYISALLIGFLFRYYKYREKGSVREGITPIPVPGKGSLIRKAAKAMHDKRVKNPSAGSIFGRGVFNAMETMLHIGGFIILFCVIVKSLELVGLFDFLRSLLPYGGDKELLNGIFAGIIEMSNGCKRISSVGIEKDTVLAALAVISWGGFSIHAQAVSFLSKTDINIAIYFLSKAAHSIVSVFLGFLIYPLFKGGIEAAHSVEASTYYANESLFSRYIDGILYFGGTITLILITVVAANGILFIMRGKTRNIKGKAGRKFNFSINPALNLVKRRKRW